MSATRSLSSSKKKKTSQPFYDASGVRTSAKIIEDARRSVRGALPTDRPFTPAEPGRILFGSQNSLSRPPSVYSIGARHFSDERLSRPGTGQKLAPIEKTVIANKSIKLSSRKKVHPTPPTPVQSFQDLSILTSPSATSVNSSNTDSPANSTTHIHRSITTTESILDSTSKTSVGSNDSSHADLKQSQSSPTHSKRSLSAGAGRRILSGGSRKALESSRVVSAGEGRGGQTKSSNKMSSPDHRTSSNCEPSKPSPVKLSSDSRKSSVSSVDLPFWDTDVLPLLKKLDATPYDNTSDLCDICDLLWVSLEKNSLLGRTGGVGGTKKRGSVLRTVFRLLDHKNPHVLMKVSKIILAMKVTSRNLLNVCKLLFAIAKSDKNDDIFKRENICAPLVDLLLTVDPHSDPEALIYGLGTVKLLASNTNLRGELGEAGVMRLLANTLQRCTDGQCRDKKHVRNILVQLTGSLRNLSDAMSLREEFLSTAIIPRLASVLSEHVSDVEIVFNISRLFSKLTIQPECQAAVMACPSLLPIFLQALTTHSSHNDITVRVCFILGNLVAEDPEAREMIFYRYSALSTINAVLENYLSQPLDKVSSPASQSATGGGKNSKSNTEDVLIKLVRLVANLSVHPEVGPSITQNKDIIDHLLHILGIVTISDHEELVLNTLATLNNLTYYSESNSFIVQRQAELAELLLKVILVDSSEGLLECTRVYGNLSRHSAVRRILADNKVDEMMVTLLDSGRRELVYCSCGVLVNLMADSEHRESLAKNGGVRKLVDVLHDFGGSDWQMATLVCKILWNYSESLSSSSHCFGEEETTQLVHLLQTYSGDSFSLDFPSETSKSNREMLFSAWQSEFLPISTSLLSRIQTYYNGHSSTQLEHLTEADYHKSER